MSLLMTASVIGQERYDFGNPNAEEQLHIERINRARANPPAEGQRLAAVTDPHILQAYTYFGVDLTMMQNEFNAIAPATPLVPNGPLTVAARGHSEWMLANNVQQHDQSATNTMATRVLDAGYDYMRVGENIYAYCLTGDYGHAGFQVDWGPGHGGMQDGRGHRANIHHPDYREIGVGVVIGGSGIHPNVGPQLVTQDFGARAGHPSFATGVAFYDLNGNDTYDIGEGISGLTVQVGGAAYDCETADGGGWVVPVPAEAATRTVTFSGLNVDHSVPLAIPLNASAKADLKLDYVPPQITGVTGDPAGSTHTLNFEAVGGATHYECTALALQDAAGERCENTDGIVSQTTGTYSILSSNIISEGASSFHLLNSTAASQWLEIDRDFHGGASPAISFQSRIRYATSDERFRVQVRRVEDPEWQTVDEQVGIDGAEQPGFLPRSITLPGMSGELFRVRFLLYFQSGGYYPNDTEIFGWFIDDIRFTDISDVETLASGTVGGTSWSFAPGSGDHLVSVAPVISGRPFPAGSQVYDAAAVSAQPATFESWAAGHENAAGLPAGTLADPHGDHDRDGRSHLLEYAFGGSPVTAADPPGSIPTSDVSGTHFTLRYRVDTTLGDVVVTPQACSIMGAWKAPGETGAPADFVVETVATEGSLETREARLPLDGLPRCFLRLRVHRP